MGLLGGWEVGVVVSVQVGADGNCMQYIAVDVVPGVKARVTDVAATA